jgi:phage gp46-like protein
MDFKILTDDDATVGQMTFDPAGDIMNNVYLSLVVKRGSWFQNPDFGSRLHLLQRAKNTEKTAALAEEYCREALAWLIDCGRATKIDVHTERDRSQDLHRLKLLVEVTQADGRTVSFDRFVEVV